MDKQLPLVKLQRPFTEPRSDITRLWFFNGKEEGFVYIKKDKLENIT